MKKKYIVLIVVAFLIAGFAVASVFAVKAAVRLFDEKRHNLLGLDLEFKSYYIDWAGARIVVEGVALYPTGKVEEKEKLASIEKMTLAISPRDIYKKKELHITKVVFEKPEVSYTRYTRKFKNWDALDLSQLGGEKKEQDLPHPTSPYKGEEEGFKVRIDDLIIKDGSVAYRDKADGGRMDLKNLNVEVENIVDEPDIKKLPTRITMSAQIDNTSGRFVLTGNANLLAKGINFNATATLSPMALTYFAPFYAGSVPFPVTQGTMSVSSQAKSVASQLTSNHHITITGLRVGGGMKGDLINKFILSKNDSLAFNAAVNGDLSTGDVSMSHTASKVIADQLVREAMEQSIIQAPLIKAGEGLKSGGKSVGDKVKGLFGH